MTLIYHPQSILWVECFSHNQNSWYNTASENSGLATSLYRWSLSLCHEGAKEALASEYHWLTSSRQCCWVYASPSLSLVAVFGIGSMIYSGLEVGQYFELQADDSCADILLVISPAARMLFTFIQMYFIFLNSRVSCRGRSRTQTWEGGGWVVSVRALCWLWHRRRRLNPPLLRIFQSLPSGPGPPMCCPINPDSKGTIQGN